MVENSICGHLRKMHNTNVEEDRKVEMKLKVKEVMEKELVNFELQAECLDAS